VIIGITGFAGSGKSYVSKIMKEKAESALMKKVLVIDADRVGHDVLSLFFIRQELVKAFGNDILNENGEIDRKALGRKVFSSRAKLAVLNAVVHPVIRQEVEKMLKEKEKSYDIIIIDAALLDQIKLAEMCSIIVLVECSEDKRVDRLVLNRSIPIEKAHAIVQSQKELNLGRSDFKIINEGNFESTCRQVEDFLSQLTSVE